MRGVGAGGCPWGLIQMFWVTIQPYLLPVTGERSFIYRPGGTAKKRSARKSSRGYPASFLLPPTPTHPPPSSHCLYGRLIQTSEKEMENASVRAEREGLHDFMTLDIRLFLFRHRAHDQKPKSASLFTQPGPGPTERKWAKPSGMFLLLYFFFFPDREYTDIYIEAV